MYSTTKAYGRRQQWQQRGKYLVAAVIVFTAGIMVGGHHLSFNLHHTKPVSANLPARLDYSTVNQVYQSLKENYDGQLNESQLEDGLKHGLAAATKDPYTTYFTSKEAKDFNSELNNTFSGIGAELGEDSDGNLEIISPIAGLPAYKAGLKPQDLIASINGQTTAGESVDDAVHKIRGPKGTKVKLQIVRNHAQTLSFTITRDNIKLPSVKTKTLGGNIGYIQVTTFAADTTDLSQKAADAFTAAHAKGLILDLRGNPGGLVDAADRLASLWLPKGNKILDEKHGSEVIDSDYASGGDKLHGIPTVVLINGGSASASEITAGALRDNGAAYLIGTKTYGKGVVQQLVNFGDGSQLKVTIASWYRPDGENINHKGITPDKTVKISESDAKAGTDTQLQAAQAYLKSK